MKLEEFIYIPPKEKASIQFRQYRSMETQDNNSDRFGDCPIFTNTKSREEWENMDLDVKNAAMRMLVDRKYELEKDMIFEVLQQSVVDLFLLVKELKQEIEELKK